MVVLASPLVVKSSKAVLYRALFFLFLFNSSVDMVRLAIEDNPHFELSLAEMHETGYTYTYRTLEELKEYNPDSRAFLI